MRIEAKITHVARVKHWNSDTLAVRADADVGEAAYGARTYESITLHVPSTASTRERFTIGATLDIEVTVRPHPRKKGR